MICRAVTLRHCQKTYLDKTLQYVDSAKNPYTTHAAAGSRSVSPVTRLTRTGRAPRPWLAMAWSATTPLTSLFDTGSLHTDINVVRRRPGAQEPACNRWLAQVETRWCKDSTSRQFATRVMVSILKHRASLVKTHFSSTQATLRGQVICQKCHLL